MHLFFEMFCYYFKSYGSVLRESWKTGVKQLNKEEDLNFINGRLHNRLHCE